MLYVYRLEQKTDGTGEHSVKVEKVLFKKGGSST